MKNSRHAYLKSVSKFEVTGFKKFAHFGDVSDPEVNSQDVENELNERLEQACAITEA